MVGGITVEGVLVEDGEVLALHESTGEGVRELRVEFYGYEFRDSVYEDTGESALARAYLEDLVVVGELGGGYYALGDIVVNEEVLSEPASSGCGGASGRG